MFIRNSFVFEFSFDKLRDGGCICITPLKLNKQFKLIHQLSLYTSSQDFCGKLNGYIKQKNLYASFLFLFASRGFIRQARRRQGVRQPKVVSGIGLWNAPGKALWNAPGRVSSGWSICTSPQKLIPSPIDSARRVTSIPRHPQSLKMFGRAGPYIHFPNTQ